MNNRKGKSSQKRPTRIDSCPKSFKFDGMDKEVMINIVLPHGAKQGKKK